MEKENCKICFHRFVISVQGEVVLQSISLFSFNYYHRLILEAVIVVASITIEIVLIIAVIILVLVVDVVTIPSNIIKEAKNIIVGRNGIDISYEKERCHFIEL